MTTLAAAALGLVAGVTATTHLHSRGGFWGRRIGRSRFRRANVPVGGIIAAVAALLLPDARNPLLAAGGAMAATATGWRYIDPLPRAR